MSPVTHRPRFLRLPSPSQRGAPPPELFRGRPGGGGGGGGGWRRGAGPAGGGATNGAPLRGSGAIPATSRRLSPWTSLMAPAAGGGTSLFLPKPRGVPPLACLRFPWPVSGFPRPVRPPERGWWRDSLPRNDSPRKGLPPSRRRYGGGRGGPPPPHHGPAACGAP